MGVEAPRPGGTPPEGEEFQGHVINFPGVEGKQPQAKPVEDQIRDEVHQRFESGDVSVPEFVTDSKGQKPAFEADPDVERRVEADKKMKKDIDDGWENINSKEFKL